jgi:hypothetical protein
MFAYCGNNPIVRIDTCGSFWDTILDIISLVSSVVDVVSDPSDPWAWAGLAGDVVDLIPFVTCVGEGVKAARAVDTAVDLADTAHDVVKVADSAHDVAKNVDNATDLVETVKKGWNVGDDITNLTKAGNIPSWSTIRQRFWKNEAFYNPELYGDQVNRLKKGLAPLDLDGIPFELHHPNGRAGENLFVFFPVTQAEHRWIHYGIK